MLIISAPLVLNIFLSMLELIIAGAEKSHFGTKAIICVVLYEIAKLLITSFIIIIFWKSKLKLSAFVIALIPFIMLIPLFIILLSNGKKFTNLINQ